MLFTDHYFVLAGSCLRIFVEIYVIQSKAQRSQFEGSNLKHVTTISFGIFLKTSLVIMI